MARKPMEAVDWTTLWNVVAAMTPETQAWVAKLIKTLKEQGVMAVSCHTPNVALHARLQSQQDHLVKALCDNCCAMEACCADDACDDGQGPGDGSDTPG